MAQRQVDEALKQDIGVIKCFFFQAEDGIRDDLVTGVQTCALPISCRAVSSSFKSRLSIQATARGERSFCRSVSITKASTSALVTPRSPPIPRARTGGCRTSVDLSPVRSKIGRASCRERG